MFQKDLNHFSSGDISRFQRHKVELRITSKQTLTRQMAPERGLQRRHTRQKEHKHRKGWEQWTGSIIFWSVDLALKWCVDKWFPKLISFRQISRSVV